MMTVNTYVNKMEDNTKIRIKDGEDKTIAVGDRKYLLYWLKYSNFSESEVIDIKPFGTQIKDEIFIGEVI